MSDSAVRSCSLILTSTRIKRRENKRESDEDQRVGLCLPVAVSPDGDPAERRKEKRFEGLSSSTTTANLWLASAIATRNIKWREALRQKASCLFRGSLFPGKVPGSGGAGLHCRGDTLVLEDEEKHLSIVRLEGQESPGLKEQKFPAKSNRFPAKNRRFPPDLTDDFANDFGGIGSFNLALGPSIWHWVLQSGIGSFNLALGPSIWLFGSLNLAVDLSIWLWISQSGCGSLNLAVDLSIWLWISQSGCGSLNLAVDLSIWLWISQSGCGSLNLTLSHSIWHWTTGGTKFRGLEDSNLADGTKIQGLEDANGSLREFQTPWI
ncbi:hypothetical protein WH47_04452 [Habropoda laboriosa]|uniref:Uncharacterized protein n=1 Tax=Habropoda laboriosa TaxID=597456 RepID=A0A0L7R203_9HYME|nr:hypothetical protein WH47_04452 [Habropoda laboriosa]